MNILWTAIRQTCKLCGSHHRLWIPFLATAIVELAGVGVVWLAPQAPFSKVLAPPIRFFFGNDVLHYPMHLWFLYHAMKHTHVVATLLAGAFLSGLAYAMVRHSHEGKPLSLHAALTSKQVRYGRVTLLWLLTWGMGKGTMEVVTRVAPKAVWVFWAGMGLAVALQWLFVYAIPSAIFDGSTWFKALLRGIGEALRYPVSTFLIILPPSAALIAFNVFVNDNAVGRWMMKTTPELVLAFIAARLMVWTVTDAWLTVGIAHLWWLHRAPQPASIRTSTATQVSPGRMKEGPAVA